MRQSTSRLSLRWWFLVLIGLIAACLIPGPLEAEPPVTENATGPSDSEIESWISQLVSPNYSKREVASKRLKDIAPQSLPTILKHLEKAEGEAYSRLLFILSEMATDTESKSSGDAFRALSRLADRMNGGRGIQAKTIFESLRQEIGKNAWERYTRQARNADKSFSSRSSPTFSVENPVIVDSTFAGTVEDLRDFEHVDWVSFARLEGSQITKQHLEAVLKLPRLSHLQLININLNNEDLKVLKQGPDLDILELQYVPIDDGIVDQLAEFPIWSEIWIYGTGMTREGFARAESVLGDVALTYSRGAFLGVRCMQDSVRVDVVEPNSAAEDCGIEKGDRLISVNDRPLKKFEDLRQELSNFAYGESVTIEFEKFQTQERIKKSVTLGRRK